MVSGNGRLGEAEQHRRDPHRIREKRRKEQHMAPLYFKPQTNCRGIALSCADGVDGRDDALDA